MNKLSKLALKIEFVILVLTSFTSGISAIAQISISSSYDNLNRLIRVNYGNGTVLEYTYDANGNRLTESVNSNSFMNVKIVLSGFYNDADDLLRMRDTVKAYLTNITAPFSIVDSSVSILDSSSFEALFVFLNATNGTYYLKIKHRNSLETWSKPGGEIFTAHTTMNYDFTNINSQSYGNNMVLINGKWCFYSGDVIQDGLIDLTDIVRIYNDATVFSTGYYVTDLNGDNFTDLTDLLIAFNNSTKFIAKITP